jgi:hypothetical protein
MNKAFQVEFSYFGITRFILEVSLKLAYELHEK